MELYLKRLVSTNKGIFGNLVWSNMPPDEQGCIVTLEPPMGLDKFGPVPDGTYKLSPFESKKYGRTVLLHVPKRVGILIHAGNVWKWQDGSVETRGCILLGYRRGDVAGVPGILYSQKAMKYFREKVLPFVSSNSQITIYWNQQT